MVYKEQELVRVLFFISFRHVFEYGWKKNMVKIFNFAEFVKIGLDYSKNTELLFYSVLITGVVIILGSEVSEIIFSSKFYVHSTPRGQSMYSLLESELDVPCRCYCFVLFLKSQLIFRIIHMVFFLII